MLRRLREGIPMISRSDGKTFHLLLADRPVPYPAERKAGPSKLVSICFWYAHIAHGNQTSTSIVILPEARHRRGAFYRSVEVVADLLTATLRHTPRLSKIYDFSDGELRGHYHLEIAFIDRFTSNTTHDGILASH